MTNPAFLSLATAVPKRRFDQQEILEKYLARIQNEHGTRRHERALRAVFNYSGVEHRYSVADEAFYATEQSTMVRNDRYMAEAVPLGKMAIQHALDAGGYTAQDIDDFIVVSCTGFSIPGLDLLLAAELGMRPDLRRSCVLGMGCYGTFPGLLRACDSVQAGRLALVMPLELCSLHLQFDESVESAIATALFADGVGAVLVGSEERRTEQSAAMGLPRIVDSVTYCEYNTLDHMSFNVTDNGFRMYLSSYVSDLLAAQIEGFIDGLLARNALTRSDVKLWGIHPGGSKILDHIQKQLGLTDEDMKHSRDVLREYGNMSSATITFVLDKLHYCGKPIPGDFGLLMAFGPGLTMEAMLVQW
jgi:alkylresorcinol/alkylpyrone synthase